MKCSHCPVGDLTAAHKQDELDWWRCRGELWLASREIIECTLPESCVKAKCVTNTMTNIRHLQTEKLLKDLIISNANSFLEGTSR